ncbi:transmembrane protein, putative [Bodo saltans]|uniref:Transmembrane protein, putative n=1 Tax=Bodo saltans TaxID=75058 RepID=A0A0S4JK60_BODSA|nr:transmembrane protein, putative [Bodo saltans]|eukprot:CUG90971.1 transmembrane protein, putative [Bodo saltans]
MCALIPPALQLPSEAMTFVVDTAASVSDKIQFSLAVQLRTVKSSCDTLFKAASERDLLTPNNALEPWQFLAWTSGIVARDNVTVILGRLDWRAIIVSPYNTLFSGDASQGYVGAIPGYVFLYVASSPGHYVNYGFFQVDAPHLPANATHPWANYSTGFTLENQPMVPKILENSPNRTTPMQWTSLSVRNTSSPSSALITYGGSFSLPIAIDPKSREQLIMVNLRGESLSDFFSHVHVSATGTAILVDAVSGAFVAGSVRDATGAYTADEEPRLVNVTELRDPRISCILHAEAVLEENAPQDSVRSASEALLSCTPPCLFTFWPHLNQLHEGRDIVPLGVIGYRFSTVCVTRVQYAAGAKLDLRLVVVLPSDDVLGVFLAGLYSSLYSPLATIVCVTVVVILSVSLVFRQLIDVEHRIHELACTMLIPSREPVTLLGSSISVNSGEPPMKSMFSEFDRLARVLHALKRELFTLRAFTFRSFDQSNETTTTTEGGVSENPPPTSRMPREHSSDASRASSCIPYDLAVNATWRVPVITVRAEIGSALLGALRLDPLVTYHRQRDVLDVLQTHVKSAPGASVDYFGDRFVVHLNASGRTPRHALVALSLCTQSAEDIARLAEAYCNSEATPRSGFSSPQPCELPFVCGIASAVAVCGMMGPAAMKVFTVISVGESQAMFLSRIAKVDRHKILLTWRAVDFAMQQMAFQRLVSTATLTELPAGRSLCANTHRYTFVPVAKVYLPGESDRSSHVYATATPEQEKTLP